MNNYWGEIETTNFDPGIAAIEREQLTRPRSLIVDTPIRLDHEFSDAVLSPLRLHNEGIILHTLRLIQHQRKIELMIQAAKTKLMELKSIQDASNNAASLFPEAPPIPHCNICDNYRPKPAHFFAPSRITQLPIMEHVPVTKEECSKHIFRSTALIATHCGFENASSIVMDTLADVLTNFLEDFTSRLRRLRDAQALGHIDENEDLLNKCLQLSGYPEGLKSLQTYWKESVIGYHDRLLARDQRLLAAYKQMKDNFIQCTSLGSPDSSQSILGQIFKEDIVSLLQSEDIAVPRLSPPPLPPANSVNTVKIDNVADDTNNVSLDDLSVFVGQSAASAQHRALKNEPPLEPLDLAPRHRGSSTHTSSVKHHPLPGSLSSNHPRTTLPQRNRTPDIHIGHYGVPFAQTELEICTSDVTRQKTDSEADKAAAALALLE